MESDNSGEEKKTRRKELLPVSNEYQGMIELPNTGTWPPAFSDTASVWASSSYLSFDRYSASSSSKKVIDYSKIPPSLVSPPISPALSNLPVTKQKPLATKIASVRRHDTNKQSQLFSLNPSPAISSNKLLSLLRSENGTRISSTATSSSSASYGEGVSSLSSDKFQIALKPPGSSSNPVENLSDVSDMAALVRTKNIIDQAQENVVNSDSQLDSQNRGTNHRYSVGHVTNREKILDLNPSKRKWDLVRRWARKWRRLVKQRRRILTDNDKNYDRKYDDISDPLPSDEWQKIPLELPFFHYRIKYARTATLTMSQRISPNFNNEFQSPQSLLKGHPAGTYLLTTGQNQLLPKGILLETQSKNMNSAKFVSRSINQNPRRTHFVMYSLQLMWVSARKSPRSIRAPEVKAAVQLNRSTSAIDIFATVLPSRRVYVYTSVPAALQGMFTTQHNSLTLRSSSFSPGRSSGGVLLSAFIRNCIGKKAVPLITLPLPSPSLSGEQVPTTLSPFSSIRSDIERQVGESKVHLCYSPQARAHADRLGFILSRQGVASNYSRDDRSMLLSHHTQLPVPDSSVKSLIDSLWTCEKAVVLHHPDSHLDPWFLAQLRVLSQRAQAFRHSSTVTRDDTAPSEVSTKLEVIIAFTYPVKKKDWYRFLLSRTIKEFLEVCDKTIHYADHKDSSREVLRACINHFLDDRNFLDEAEYSRLSHEYDVSLYRREAELSGTLKSNRIKLFTVGHGEVGKTSILRALSLLEHDPLLSEFKYVDERTKMVELGVWHDTAIPAFDCKNDASRSPKETIKHIEWVLHDFPGQVEYYATNTLFLSVENSLIMLVFKLNDFDHQDPSNKAILQVKLWLSTLNSLKPKSYFVDGNGSGNEHHPIRVIIIGSHSDLASEEALHWFRELPKLLQCAFPNVSFEGFVSMASKNAAQVLKLRRILHRIGRELIINSAPLPRSILSLTTSLESWRNAHKVLPQDDFLSLINSHLISDLNEDVRSFGALSFEEDFPDSHPDPSIISHESVDADDDAELKSTSLQVLDKIEPSSANCINGQESSFQSDKSKRLPSKLSMQRSFDSHLRTQTMTEILEMIGEIVNPNLCQADILALDPRWVSRLISLIVAPRLFGGLDVVEGVADLQDIDAAIKLHFHELRQLDVRKVMDFLEALHVCYCMGDLHRVCDETKIQKDDPPTLSESDDEKSPAVPRNQPSTVAFVKISSKRTGKLHSLPRRTHTHSNSCRILIPSRVTSRRYLSPQMLSSFGQRGRPVRIVGRRFRCSHNSLIPPGFLSMLMCVCSDLNHFATGNFFAFQEFLVAFRPSLSEATDKPIYALISLAEHNKFLDLLLISSSDCLRASTSMSKLPIDNLDLSRSKRPRKSTSVSYDTFGDSSEDERPVSGRRAQEEHLWFELNNRIGRTLASWGRLAWKKSVLCPNCLSRWGAFLDSKGNGRTRPISSCSDWDERTFYRLHSKCQLPIVMEEKSLSAQNRHQGQVTMASSINYISYSGIGSITEVNLQQRTASASINQLVATMSKHIGLRRITLDQLHFHSDIPFAEGEFSRNFKGTLDGMCPVMIKKLKTKEFGPGELQELLMLGSIKPHPHVVTVKGICIPSLDHDERKPNSNQDDPGVKVWLVTELAAKGSLDSLLLRADTQSRHALGLTLRDGTGFFRLALELANGLQHLHEHKIVHRDIAARNILLDNSYNIQITDLGLSRRMHASNEKNNGVEQFEYYQCVNGGKLPVRWMAPESLIDLHFSAKSDIWMLGVTFYEIVMGMKLADESNSRVVSAEAQHQCLRPYRQFRDSQEVVRLLIRNQVSLVHDLPESCPSRIRDLISWCLQPDAKARPAAQEIVDFATKYLDSKSHHVAANAACDFDNTQNDNLSTMIEPRWPNWFNWLKWLHAYLRANSRKFWFTGPVLLILVTLFWLKRKLIIQRLSQFYQ